MSTDPEFLLPPDGEVTPVARSFHTGRESNDPKAVVTPDGTIIGQPLSVIDPTPRPAPSSGGAFLSRYKAFQLYLGGERQTDIARVIGVTRQRINQWKSEDEWDARLDEMRLEAANSATFIQGNVLAVSATKLRAKLEVRIHELELLCASTVPPAIRLGAIKLWIELATKLTDQSEKERAAATPAPDEVIRPSPVITGLESLHQES